jgi:organic radical activating enzyme
MALEVVYNVADAYATVHAEGYAHGGKPVILVRLGMPNGWKYNYVENLRPLKTTKYSTPELVDKINQLQKATGSITNLEVHLCGNDPAYNDLQPLVHMLSNIGYPISIDTSGALLLPSSILGKVAQVTVYARPGLPLYEAMLHIAEEIRFAFTAYHDEFHRFLIEMIEAYPAKTDKFMVCPTSKEPKVINDAIQVCLENNIRFHIPLYKAMPDFDAGFQGNKDASKTFWQTFQGQNAVAQDDPKPVLRGEYAEGPVKKDK